MLIIGHPHAHISYDEVNKNQDEVILQGGFKFRVLLLNINRRNKMHIQHFI